ncbi:MAG: branched-chain amino acid ABC transporter permease [Chloroflexota bacterium]
MQQFIIVTLNGLTQAALFFVVASGFSLIFGLMRVVNMAHGTLYAIGAYIGWSIWDTTGNWWIALTVAPLVAVVLGVLMQRFLLTRVQGDDLQEALVTIAVSIIVGDLLLQRYGGAIRQVQPPEIITGATTLLETESLRVIYPTFRLFTLFAAILIGFLLWYLLNRTKLGMVIRAGIDDRAMVDALGINIDRTFILVFGLGALLAGLGGFFGASALSLRPGDDGVYLLSSLIVVIVGGMGSLGGAALGAILVGLAGQYGLAYTPTYAILITFVIMVLVLAVRPQGILGRNITR